MKMPKEEIEEIMFAPCGMNCLVCYKHCYHKKPCDGCLKSDYGKPEHCRKCNIKKCINSKGIKYCFNCDNFPCNQINNLEKSYNIRYNVSLKENSLFVKEKGLLDFMKQQRLKYICNKCGGVISLHDAECSECRSPINDLRKD